MLGCLEPRTYLAVLSGAAGERCGGTALGLTLWPFSVHTDQCVCMPCFHTCLLICMFIGFFSLSLSSLTSSSHSYFIFCWFDLGPPPICAQGLDLSLCSGIIPGRTRGPLEVDGDGTWVGHMQGKYSLTLWVVVAQACTHLFLHSLMNAHPPHGSFPPLSCTCRFPCLHDHSHSG